MLESDSSKRKPTAPLTEQMKMVNNRIKTQIISMFFAKELRFMMYGKHILSFSCSNPYTVTHSHSHTHMTLSVK